VFRSSGVPGFGFQVSGFGLEGPECSSGEIQCRV